MNGGMVESSTIAVVAEQNVDEILRGQITGIVERVRKRAQDILDRLDPDERLALVDRLVELTAPGARLYAVIDASGAATAVQAAATALAKLIVMS